MEMRIERMKGMEEMGMTDLQFKSYLMELVAELERIKELKTDDEKREAIDRMIARYTVTIES